MHGLGGLPSAAPAGSEIGSSGMGIVDIERDRARSSGIDDGTSFGDRETFSRIKTTRCSYGFSDQSRSVSRSMPLDVARCRSILFPIPFDPAGAAKGLTVW
jgi:hypothetical protein